MDHIVWKFDVCKVVLGMSDKNKEEFADHTACRLGQWYYQGEGLKLKHLPAFKMLEEPHKRVHDNGIQAIDSACENNHNEVFNALSKMEEASDSVIQLLSELENELSK